MKQIYPDYFPDFHCLAGSCPDTCCKDWEIVIDPETLRYYRQLPGEFGQQVRSSLVDLEGDICFRVESGHCPFQNEEGLCEIQLRLGEEHLCKTCYSHPRFIEEYGSTQEISLSLSCPAVADLLLRRDAPLTFVTRCTEDEVTDMNELDAELYHCLLTARKAAMALVQDRAISLGDRIGLLLIYCSRLQALIDRQDYGRCALLTARFREPETLDRQLARIHRLRRRKRSFFPLALVLNNMEHLTDRFPALLQRVFDFRGDVQAFDREYAAQAENLMVYFLFRYFLKAVNDGRLLCRAAGCVFHLLSIRQLFCAGGFASMEELCRLCSLYSKEVEHSDENIGLLQRIVDRGTLSWRDLLILSDFGG